MQSGSPLIFVKNLKVSVFKAFQHLMFTFFSFPLLKLSVNSCVLRSIYLHLGVWTISTFHHFFTVHQYNCVKNCVSLRQNMLLQIKRKLYCLPLARGYFRQVRNRIKGHWTFSQLSVFLINQCYCHLSAKAYLKCFPAHFVKYTPLTVECVTIIDEQP